MTLRLLNGKYGRKNENVSSGGILGSGKVLNTIQHNLNIIAWF
jgi:hypothetical protein